MRLFFGRFLSLRPTHSPALASALLLGLALAGAAPASALAQQAAAANGPGNAPGRAGASSDNRLGSPMGEPLGAQAVEPLQRSVEASRQPVYTGQDPNANAPVGANNPGMALRMDKGQDPAGPVAGSGGVPPLNSAASVGADYRIGPSDLLDFDVYGVPDMQRTVRVNASGVVSLPLIGPVALAGLNTAQAEALIAQKYEKDFLQNPQVSLFIKEFTSQRITIEGAVAKPGIYPVTGTLTLLRALALAGGGGQYALLNEVMLFRSGSSLEANTQMFDLEKIRTGEIADPIINADDVIVVKRDPKRTALRDSFFGDLLSTLNPFK